jgi:hypothetical protein
MPRALRHKPRASDLYALASQSKLRGQSPKSQALGLEPQLPIPEPSPEGLVPDPTPYVPSHMFQALSLV